MGVDWSTIKNGKINVSQIASKNVKESAFFTSYQWTNGVWDVYALLDAFEGLEIGEVISKPQVKVMTGTEGEVQIGKNFYLTIRDYAGNTQFREYEAGTILKVIPNVIMFKDTTFIHLNLHVERSSVQEASTGVVKDIIESKTQVLLLDGERTVIAGLYNKETKNIRKGVPLLKDLPWWCLGLKYIFGFNSKSITKKELIILIKADLIDQISKRKFDNDTQNNNFDALRKRIK